ncbi:GNAT family N-acetyltransferase [Undibacterium sp. Jales W-56]|uniref:GNAT family N-acetyltransferase n=1 Tax=Undibacterium sp. Jales W-56 TaxID=2897325 RepID=UPI0021CF3917|nr:GNAT family N-acetyltransferase [Undibacterium sp. Jales W-56]MCU6434291.1 GNAT family N-acetyltransferase [Undibacterium sp. Jales W-56]
MLELIAASANDFEELLALRIRAMQPSLERLGRFDPQRARERLRASYDPAVTRHIMCGGRRIGFVALKPCEGGILLDHLYLDPAFHGQGFGSQVLQQIFKETDQQGAILHVGALRASRANRFYRKHGFIYSHETEWDICYRRPPAILRNETMQTGILQTLPAHASYLTFNAKANTDAPALRSALTALAKLVDGEKIVLGIGANLASKLGAQVNGLRNFDGIADSRVRLPATPADLWCWLRADERGALVHHAQQIQTALQEAFELQHQLDAFKYDTGRDLTGYEDGTENPQDEAAFAAAIVQAQGPGLDGSSMVAVQQWRHQFEKFDAMSSTDQDNAIGRRKSDNEELEDAPESAHVKRTAQEDFTPEAFSLRRSMPWTEQGKAGLHFVSFGNSFYAFEAQLRRMSGAEDGIVDALFKFSHPVSGSYFWCPPMKDGQIDLCLLHID